jgi:hypothetical protein
MTIPALVRHLPSQPEERAARAVGRFAGTDRDH